MRRFVTMNSVNMMILSLLTLGAGACIRPLGGIITIYIIMLIIGIVEIGMLLIMLLIFYFDSVDPCISEGSWVSPEYSVEYGRCNNFYVKESPEPVVEWPVFPVCKYGSDAREVVLVVPDATCMLVVRKVVDLRVAAMYVAWTIRTHEECV